MDVCVEDLLASVVALTGIGEDLAAAQAVVQRRVEDASPGWQGLSAAGLSAALSGWAEDTAALLQRIGEHAAALDLAARTVRAMETEHAAALR